MSTAACSAGPIKGRQWGRQRQEEDWEEDLPFLDAAAEEVPADSVTPAAFSALVRRRRSVRSFDPARPVDEGLLRRVLFDAQWAPSWCNTAPYYLCVARGARRQRIRSALLQRYDAAVGAMKSGGLAQLRLWACGGAPDGDYDTQIKYPPVLNKYRRACGHGLYGYLGIGRTDQQGRSDQTRRNFEFFDAPVVIFVFVHGAMGVYSPLDAGFFLQTLLLSAQANGLGTIAQGALAMWAGPIRSEFPEVPEGWKLLCGVSMGYATEDRVNSYNPGRRKPRGSFGFPV